VAVEPEGGNGCGKRHEYLAAREKDRPELVALPGLCVELGPVFAE